MRTVLVQAARPVSSNAPAKPQGSGVRQDPGLELLNALLARPIAFHRPLVPVTGGVGSALFLSQLMYWTPRGKDITGWIYKTQVEWEAETGLTPVEQQTIRKRLVKLGFLQERKRGVPARLFYRINLQRLADALADPHSSFPQHGKLVSRDTGGKFTVRRAAIPETTAGTSAENTEAKAPRPAEIGEPGPLASKPIKISKTRKRTTTTTTTTPHRSRAPSTEDFTRFWTVIPKRMSYGKENVSAWEQWKAINPDRERAREMASLLSDFLDGKEELDDYVFYDFDGSEKVTPAQLVWACAKAVNEGRSLSDVLPAVLPDL